MFCLSNEESEIALILGHTEKTPRILGVDVL